jgi:hypothetical protein
MRKFIALLVMPGDMLHSLPPTLISIGMLESFVAKAASI